ncbi:MAG: hypothetical protein RLZZ501_1214 [Pseudomonadota bacterium]
MTVWTWRSDTPHSRQTRPTDGQTFPPAGSAKSASRSRTILSIAGRGAAQTRDVILMLTAAPSRPRPSAI